MLHYYVDSLDDDNKSFIQTWASENSGLILQAHSHRDFDYYIGGTRIVGLKTLDPEKAIANPPGFDILEIDGDEYTLTPCFMPLSANNLADFRDFLGISCANNDECLDYAIEHGIKNIEIRKPEFDNDRISILLDKVSKWRTIGGKVLSIHMTDIKYDGSEFTGIDTWNKCIELAKLLKVDSMTVHVPRVKVKYMNKGGEIWNKYLELILPGLHSIPNTTAIAIENLHMNPGEPSDKNRGFGYIPEEVMDWIAAVNADFGYERAGHLFDIGHARNNAPFRSKYTLGAWYSIIGKRINAYHIHQVRNTGTPSHNHKSIINWYGGVINFFAFWLAWQKNQINHKPMFLELKSVQCYDESYEALNKFEVFKK